MNEVMKYKGYLGSIEIDMDEKVLHGKVLFINGLITYEAVKFDIDELQKAFEESVDEYLADCEESGITPEKTCKGQFNVRIPPELHVNANLVAKRNNESLNALIKRALESEIYGNSSVDKIGNHAQTLITPYASANH